MQTMRTCCNVSILPSPTMMHDAYEPTHHTMNAGFPAKPLSTLAPHTSCLTPQYLVFAHWNPHVLILCPISEQHTCLMCFHAGGLSFVDTKDTWYNLRQSRNGLMTMSMSELRGTAPMRIFSWSPVPSINPLGCYKDYKVSSTEAGPAGNDDWTQHAWPLRDFPNARVDAAMTTETCAQIASENGSQYFGTQEGQECW